MTEEISEQIKMVADFMEINVRPFSADQSEIIGMIKVDADGGFSFKDGLEYYSPNERWDDLMPVVEKIEGLGYDSRINAYNSESAYFVYLGDIYNNGASFVSKLYSEAAKLETLWLAVVDFIKWHNENK